MNRHCIALLGLGLAAVSSCPLYIWQGWNDQTHAGKISYKLDLPFPKIDITKAKPNNVTIKTVEPRRDVKKSAQSSKTGVVGVQEQSGFIKHQIRFEKGGSIAGALLDLHIPYQKIYPAIRCLKFAYNYGMVMIGDEMTLMLDRNNKLFKMIIKPRGSSSNVEIFKNSLGKFAYRYVRKKYHKWVSVAKFQVESSIFNNAIKHGLSKKLATTLTSMYADKLNAAQYEAAKRYVIVLFERYFDDDGIAQSDGDILHASLFSRSGQFNFYKYTTKSGYTGYFDEFGNEIINNLMTKPLLVNCPISSKFGYRMHPIRVMRLFHRGVDYAAKKGSEILAAGNGIVRYVGYKRGYGNYIKIQHARGYSTAYAHIRNFRKEIKVGSTVRRGQVIAYVGDTGRVTGPHLHYEIMLNDKYIDPLSFHISNQRVANRIPEGEITKFQNLISFLGHIEHGGSTTGMATRNISISGSKHSSHYIEQ